MDISLRRMRHQDGRPVWIAAAFIALAGCAAYWNSFDGPFIFDDPSSIVGNPTVRDLGNLPRVLRPPGGGVTVSGRPILNLTVAIDYALADKLPGTNPPVPKVQVFHVTNLIIHILAGLALFGVIRRTLLLPRVPGRLAGLATPLALAASTLWLLHPLQTEAVTYIIQRAESLVSLFYLLTIYCTIRLATEREERLWSAAAVGACVLGMASKEVMVSAPLLVLLYDRAFLAGSFKAAWQKRWRLYAGLAATWGLLAYLVAGTGARGGTAGFGTRSTPWEYARTQFGVIVHYLRLTVWPDRLTLDYSWPVATDLGEIVPPAILVLVLAGATVWAVIRRPMWGVPAALFFLALAPTSSIVPIDDLAFEHRMYLPLAGLTVVLVVGAFCLVDRLPGRRKVVHAAAAVLAIALACAMGLRTRVRNEDYRSKLTLWKDCALKSPHSARAQYSVGGALGEGADALQRLAEQRRAAATQMECMGEATAARKARQEALELLDKAESALLEAEQFNGRAVTLAPNNVAAIENLAHTYTRLSQVVRARGSEDFSREGMVACLGWLEKAAAAYSRTLDVAPDNAEARQKLHIARSNIAILRKRLGLDRP